jgi:serine phosphatase RsbU (regulator of sigma subunit)
VGKGPEAAIASTSVLTICHDFCAIEKTMSSFLAKLNKTAAELFQNTSISTVGGISLTKDGHATIFNHGFSGWLKIRGQEVELIPQRGTSLGQDPESTFDGIRMQMIKGDRLVIFSDGVAEGPRAIKKVTDALKRSPNQSLPELTQLILETGKFSVVEDDRTIVIIECIG